MAIGVAKYLLSCLAVLSTLSRTGRVVRGFVWWFFGASHVGGATRRRAYSPVVFYASLLTQSS